MPASHIRTGLEVARRMLPAVLVAIYAMPASAENAPVDTKTSLSALLTTRENQWVFNHLCVPAGILGANRYTTGDFVEAYFTITRDRWAAAQTALQQGDEKASMTAVAPILHSMIDAYWPKRLVRDETGAITAFRDCAALGQLPGILREEHGGSSGPTGAVADHVKNEMAQVIRLWKQGRPYEEAEAILRTGPLKVSQSALALPLPIASGSSSLETPAGPSPAALIVTEEDGIFRLAVPASRLVMTLPRGTLARETTSAGGATSNPRYFHFTDSDRGINLSGWFESAESYAGFDKLWGQQIEAWRKGGMPSPLNAVKSRLDGWELVSYDISLPSGSDAHIRAEWVQDGMWIDLHVSVGNSQPIESVRATALEIFKSIRVSEAPQKQ
jgi:hypothetical protein